MVLNYFYNLVPFFAFLTGLVVALAWKQKFKTKLNIFFWGAAAWTASIVVKSLVAVVLNAPMYAILFPVSPYLFYIYLGLLTGIFEIFIPLYIILKRKKLFTKIRERLGFGIGFGSFEAIVLGILSFLSFAIIIFAINMIPEEALASYSLSNETYLITSFYASLERLSAIVFHVFSAILIFMYAFKKQLSYLLSAIVYKTFIDATAGFFSFTAGFTIVEIEAFYLAIALISILVMWKVLKIKI